MDGKLMQVPVWFGMLFYHVHDDQKVQSNKKNDKVSQGSKILKELTPKQKMAAKIRKIQQ